MKKLDSKGKTDPYLEPADEFLVHGAPVVVDQLDLLVGAVVGVAVVDDDVKAVWKRVSLFESKLQGTFLVCFNRTLLISHEIQDNFSPNNPTHITHMSIYDNLILNRQNRVRYVIYRKNLSNCTTNQYKQFAYEKNNYGLLQI